MSAFFTAILCVCIGITASMCSNDIVSGKLFVVIPLAVLILLLLVALTFIYLQPTSGKKLAFSVCRISLIGDRDIPSEINPNPYGIIVRALVRLCVSRFHWYRSYPHSAYSSTFTS